MFGRALKTFGYLPCQSNRRNIQCYSGEAGSYTSSGCLRSKPPMTKLGILKVSAIVVVSICIGALISKNGAEFLEKNEIFVPEDD